MIKTYLLPLFMIIFSANTFAEYRVYQYIVKNNVKIKDAPNGHLVISTLNPRSYLAYHGGSNLVNIDLLRTWMCPGNTGMNKPTCDSPYGELPKGVLQ